MSIHWGGRGAGHVSRWSASTTGVPALVLNFLTTTSLDSRITFTRATTATFVGSNGLIQTAAINAPRFDYDPVTLAPKGLLIEEQRTNDILYSSGVAGTGWQTSQAGTATIATTLNYSVAPDGTTTATRVIFNNNGGSGTGNFAWFGQVVLGRLIGTSYADSIWLKTNNNSTVTLLFRDDTAARFNQLITITGTWTRFSLAGVATSVGTQCCKIWIRSGVGTSTFADISAWGGQSERGTFSTSYIPTTTLAVLRSADIATMTGTNFSSWYNQTEGTFVAAYEASPNTFTTYLAASNGVVAQNSMHMDNDGAGNMRVAYYSGSSAVALLSLGAVGTIGAVNRIATAYKVNDFAASRNGGTVVTDTLGAVPVSVTQLNIGADPSGAATNVTNTHIQSIRYYNTRLLNSQLQTLSQ